MIIASTLDRDQQAPGPAGAVVGSASPPTVSVVAPMFNEDGNVLPFVRAVAEVLKGGDDTWEIVLVDDGSKDATWSRIEEATREEPRVRGVSLSRNFGHQSALFAGLESSTGAAVVSMDGDLQHPPELLPELLAAWRRGNKVVLTQRIDAEDTSLFKRVTSRGFYRVFSKLSGVQMTPGSSDFRLLDRAVIEAIREMGDDDLFLRGIVSWLGFPSTTLPFQANPRFSGRTKYSLKRMLKFSFAAITSFSGVPLRLGIWIGFATSLLAFAEIVYIVVNFFQGATVAGWASVMTFLSFMFAILFVLVGIIGVYVGKIHDVVKNRPRYVVHQRSGFPAD